MALLEIKNLTVSFDTVCRALQGGGRDRFRTSILEKCLAIVGESGSGKSVEMLAVMGLLPPTATVTADRMTFDGKDMLADVPRRQAKGCWQGHRDDLPGAGRIAEPLLHDRLSA